jgi:hypothetical protein
MAKQITVLWSTKECMRQAYEQGFKDAQSDPIVAKSFNKWFKQHFRTMTADDVNKEIQNNHKD